MYLNIDTEDNLSKCAEAGEHDYKTNHVLFECPTFSEGDDYDTGLFLGDMPGRPSIDE